MCRAQGNKEEEKWDNCNSIINKIHLKIKSKREKEFYNFKIVKCFQYYKTPYITYVIVLKVKPHIIVFYSKHYI